MTHPDSPVQPGDKTPLWPLFAAAAGALAIWTYNNPVDDPRPVAQAEAGAALPLSRKATLEQAGGSLAGLFSEDDYPRASIREREEGVVVFRLDIDARGRARCTVTQSSGFSRLDRVTCKILGRARFKPALDANGKPAPDRVVNRVRWVLPR